MPAWFKWSKPQELLSPHLTRPRVPSQMEHLDDYCDLSQQSQRDTDSDMDPTRRLRPIQFAPSRLATLYISPSERNLYLAAMSQLDEPAPSLPLWSDPAPALPQLKLDCAPIPAPHVAYPTSPKMVSSPGVFLSNGAFGGLMVRDEFRRIEPRDSQHALLALTGDAGIRLTAFPASVVVAVITALKTWPQGIAGQTETLASLEGRGDAIASPWRARLHGRAWRRKGSQELASIRLFLSVLSALGAHGWTMVGSVQAAASKHDSHNLMFSYSAETESTPPLFFAITLPLPDRISLISPPPRSTPALISAVRDAIVHARSRTDSSDEDAKRIVWSKTGCGVKLEGWVHSGVYRFWIAGMRHWPGGRVKRDVVASVHPPLILSIIDSLSALHFDFIGSIPLLPFSKGRDVLIFSSLPSSGLTLRDAFAQGMASEAVVNLQLPASRNQNLKATPTNPITGTAPSRAVNGDPHSPGTEPDFTHGATPIIQNLTVPTPADAHPWPAESKPNVIGPQIPAISASEAGSVYSTPPSPPAAAPRPAAVLVPVSNESPPKPRILKKSSLRKRLAPNAVAVAISHQQNNGAILDNEPWEILGHPSDSTLDMTFGSSARDRSGQESLPLPMPAFAMGIRRSSDYEYGSERAYSERGYSNGYPGDDGRLSTVHSVPSVAASEPHSPHSPSPSSQRQSTPWAPLALGRPIHDSEPTTPHTPIVDISPRREVAGAITGVGGSTGGAASRSVTGPTDSSTVPSVRGSMGYIPSVTSGPVDPVIDTLNEGQGDGDAAEG